MKNDLEVLYTSFFAKDVVDEFLPIGDDADHSCHLLVVFDMIILI